MIQVCTRPPTGQARDRLQTDTPTGKRMQSRARARRVGAHTIDAGHSSWEREDIANTRAFVSRRRYTKDAVTAPVCRVGATQQHWHSAGTQQLRSRRRCAGGATCNTYRYIIHGESRTGNVFERATGQIFNAIKPSTFMRMKLGTRAQPYR